MKRILITGVGGIGGINFLRSLRLVEKQCNERFFIVGTEYSVYYIEFPEADVKFRTPRHIDPEFIPILIKLIKDYKLEFIHPHPSPEAKIVSENKRIFEDLSVKMFLPRAEDIMPDKFYMYGKLSLSNVPVPETIRINSMEDIDEAFEKLGSPLWIRSIIGAGGRLSLKVNNPEEAKLWVKLNVIQGRARMNEFIIQEYLPGRDLAFDSLWFNGRLITSYARERIEYPFKHISLSGVTGTPSVARIVYDDEVNSIGIAAVKALNSNPHGFYSVDLKDDVNGKPKVTEVDGKWHTTAPLWGYSFMKVYNNPLYNIAYTYIKLGYGEEISGEIPEINLFPNEHYLIRQMDSGIILKSERGCWRIL
ncbi:MAG: ATP-grasp domain-containing protein [Candidatus Methanomethylicia archaeon]|nr:ATP-grasp domain-containing protein [Candidatus Methanomethylicia archaeon]